MKRALPAMFSKVDTLARLVVRSLPTPPTARRPHVLTDVLVPEVTDVLVPEVTDVLVPEGHPVAPAQIKKACEEQWNRTRPTISARHHHQRPVHQSKH